MFAKGHTAHRRGRQSGFRFNGDGQVKVSKIDSNFHSISARSSMKTIMIGAFALASAVPAVAQTTPAADPHAGHFQAQSAAPQGQQHKGHAMSMDEMHKDMVAMHKDMAVMQKHCQEMMKHHGMDHGAKSGTPTAPAPQDHKDHKGQ